MIARCRAFLCAVRSRARERSLVGLVALVMVLSCSQRDEQLELGKRHQSVRQLYRLVSRYEQEHGVLPASERGPAYALYELKSLAEETVYEPIFSDAPLGTRAFDVLYGPFERDRALWHDSERRVESIDYEYLNAARSLNRALPEFAVYAEKVEPKLPGRWVVFCNGAMLWVSRRNQFYESVLGKSWKQLHIGEPSEQPQPVGSLGRAELSGWTNQMIAVRAALLSYEADHGSLPVSDQGWQHALYLLKPYLGDAELLDGFNTKLENGAAYWNDETATLENSDFVYLNKNVAFDVDSGNVAILASMWGARSADLRVVLFSNRGAYWIRRGSQSAEAPLGKRGYELEVP